MQCFGKPIIFYIHDGLAGTSSLFCFKLIADNMCLTFGNLSYPKLME